MVGIASRAQILLAAAIASGALNHDGLQESADRDRELRESAQRGTKKANFSSASAPATIPAAEPEEWVEPITGTEEDRDRRFPGFKFPSRILSLPIDRRGFPVPYFVEWIKGEPDFRVMSSEAFTKCVRDNRCWICGQKMGRYKTFVVGPMCGINRTSGEPPSHKDCAIFAAEACPFLTMPKMKRNEKGLEDLATQPMGGTMLKRNPGVTLLWTTTSYNLFGDGKGGVLLRMGTPEDVLWFTERRAATRDEILRSVESGLPSLEALCETDDDRKTLEAMKADFMAFLPPG